MKKLKFQKIVLLLVSLLLSSQACSKSKNSDLKKIARFDVFLSENLSLQDFTGFVYIIITKKETPLDTRSWFSPDPPTILRKKLENFTGSHFEVDFFKEKGRLSRVGESYSPGSLESGTYLARAIVRKNPFSPYPGEGEGDFFGPWHKIWWKEGKMEQGFSLHLDAIVSKKSKPQDEEFVKYYEMSSDLLQDFHGFETLVPISVLLPQAYTEADKAQVKYPVVYNIFGFGVDIFSHTDYVKRLVSEPAPRSAEVIQVFLDGNNLHGHHLFLNSENTGPWEDVMIEEIVPFIESRFRVQDGKSRFLTGLSSGGWSCIWLQVNNPDFFDGCWSHMPDPVTFFDFQEINLYGEDNAFFKKDGGLRPIVSQNGKALFYYKDFIERETVTDPGGLISTFESTFSRKGEDGWPEKFFDRVTGEVNASTIEHWKQFDLLLKILDEWPKIGGKIRNKLIYLPVERMNFTWTVLWS